MTDRISVVAVLVFAAGCQSIGSSPAALDQARKERLESRLRSLAAQRWTMDESGMPVTADPRVQNAIELLTAGRDQDALVVLAAVLRDDPQNTAAIRLTAGTARRLGDWRLQNAALRQLIELEADAPTVLHQAGTAILQSLPRTGADDGLRGTALAALRRAVELVPENPRFAQDLFVALAEAGRDDEAETVLARALENCPEDSLLPMAAARFFEARGRWSEAIAQYDAALRISPRNRLWRRQRGICHARLQNWTKACEDLQPALRGTPVRSQLTEFLTWADAAWHARNPAEAIEVLDLLRDRAGHRTPETEMLRIRSLMQLHKPDAATDVALQAMIDWPQHTELRRLAGRLDKPATHGSAEDAEAGNRLTAAS